MRLAILGAGGHGRVLAEAATSAGWGEVALFDDQAPGVAGTGNDLARRLAKFDGVIVGIGRNLVRRRHHLHLRSLGASLATVVHPAAVVSPSARLGAGCYVGPLAVVGTGATIGDGVIVNSAAVIDHDCRIGDFVHVAPGSALSGAVQLGDGVWIGTGSALREGVAIGDWTLVGAGSVVLAALPPQVVAYGNPARVRRPQRKEDVPC